jgi:hypothetical protein
MSIGKILSDSVTTSSNMTVNLDLEALEKAWTKEPVYSFRRAHERHIELCSQLFMLTGMDFYVTANHTKLRLSVSYSVANRPSGFRPEEEVTNFVFYDGDVSVIKGYYEFRKSKADEKFHDSDTFISGFNLHSTRTTSNCSRAVIYPFLITFCNALRIPRISDDSTPGPDGAAEEFFNALQNLPSSPESAGFMMSPRLDIGAPYQQIHGWTTMLSLKLVLNAFDSPTVQNALNRHEFEGRFKTHEKYVNYGTFAHLDLLRKHANESADSEIISDVLSELWGANGYSEIVKAYLELFKLFRILDIKRIDPKRPPKSESLELGIEYCRVMHHLINTISLVKYEYVYPVLWKSIHMHGHMSGLHPARSDSEPDY